jgi:pantoate kinase
MAGRRVRHRRVAHAFAPGHLTGIFAPVTGVRDPRGRGSLGAGVVLDRGAWAEAVLDGEGPGRLRVASDLRRPVPISRDVARRLRVPSQGSLEVRIRHELPIGQGFGMSAAGALATGLAVARLLGRRPEEAAAVAHLADLFGGGGLGGVAAILGGGWERRVVAGIPPFGRIEHRRFPWPLTVAVRGRALWSPPLLGDPRFLHRVRVAGAEGLRRLGRHPTGRAFLEVSEEFTDRMDLADPPLRAAIADARSSGAWAGQAMFGRTVWAVPRSPDAADSLDEAWRRRGVRSVVLRAAAGGAWAADGPGPVGKRFERSPARRRP